MSIYSTRECAHLLSACWRLLALGIRIRDDGTALAEKETCCRQAIAYTKKKQRDLIYYVKIFWTDRSSFVFTAIIFEKRPIYLFI